MVKSTDGGASFGAPVTVAAGISSVPVHAPGGLFRISTIPSSCCGAGNHLVCAWSDFREGSCRIYYARSNNGGTSWQSAPSGDPLLTGALASPPGQEDVMPQIAALPSGEIGCAWYQFGPKGGSATRLIDVKLALSTNDGHTFTEVVTVTDSPWDPAMADVWAHGDPTTTFIGDYFGLGASRLGFFPFWTDTRTGVQEIFSSRMALNPADAYIRDSSADMGTVPSPGFHWEAPDLVVRWSPGATPFTNQGIQSPILNDHYIYARVTNPGPNTARNVTVSVTVANWPLYAGLPGTEFRYPQDWFAKDWNTPGLLASRRVVGETTPIDIPPGPPVTVGPIVWPMAAIPPSGGGWHPCLLADVRADNNDSCGGTDGCASADADPDPCFYGAYFWATNNACQLNLSYVPAPALLTAKSIVYPFLVGSPWSRSRFIHVIIDKGPVLAEVPMLLAHDPQLQDGKRELASELVAAAGPALRFEGAALESSPGVKRSHEGWHLHQPRSSVSFPVAPGQQVPLKLVFEPPRKLKHDAVIRVFQRNEHHQVTGGVQLVLRAHEHHDQVEEKDRKAD
jgi:hypothetical protein